jgi:hypothetical protein
VGEEVGDGAGVGEPTIEGADAAGGPAEGSGVGTETVGSGMAEEGDGVPAGVALCSAAIN